MKTKYELIDDFPSSLAKYQVSFIAATIEGHSFEPCERLYEQEDTHKNESVEDIVERLAFEHTEELQFYIDAKKQYFNSRRIKPILLANYLKSTYKYDPVKLSDFNDDKKSLFLMLYHETYNSNTIELSDDFVTAQVAAHKFKDKRDRMTTINERYTLEELEEPINEFEELMQSGDNKTTICNSYYDGNMDSLTVLLRQEHKRKMEPQYEYRLNGLDEPKDYPEITYVEQYPIRQTAIRFKSVDIGTEIQVYSAVSPWKDSLMKFFLTIIDKDIVSLLSAKQSQTATKIIEDIKETSNDEQNIESASQVQNIVKDNVSKAAQNVDDEDSTLDKDFIESKLSEILVTGVQVDVDDSDTTFEVHSKKGISKLLSDYDGMSSSLSKAVSSANIEDITLFAEIPNSSDDENDEIVLEEGEWSMSSNSSEGTLKALEAALK